MKKLKAVALSFLLFVSFMGSTFAGPHHGHGGHHGYRPPVHHHHHVRSSSHDWALPFIGGAMIGILVNESQNKRPVVVMPDNYQHSQQPSGIAYTCNVQVVDQYGYVRLEQRVCVR